MTGRTEDGMNVFSVGGAFFANLLGIGGVSPQVSELMEEKFRPGYVIGAQGWHLSTWGIDDDQQWVMSWVAVAGLHGMIDALRAQLPDQLREEYARIRRDAFPVGRDALAAASASFAADPDV